MSSNESYLQGFDRLGDQIYYRQPGAGRGPTSNDPDLIILCSWLYAKDRHISKYTDQYQKQFPAVPILLLKQDGPDLLWRPNSWQYANMKPAIAAVRNIQAQAESVSKAKILVHVWSNGGAYTVTQFADALIRDKTGTSTTENSKTTLPLSALIIDSAPSAVGMRSGFTAMSQGFPPSWPQPVRLLLGGIAYSVMFTSATIGKACGSEGAISGMRRKLNDVAGPFIGDGVARMYMYSESDELIPWRDVEEHAREAGERLGKVRPDQKLISMEKFEGSRHVGHAMKDPEKYWSTVLSFWKASSS